MIRSARAENPWLAQTAILERIVPEIAGVATYRFRFADGELNRCYAFAPGQFNMVYLPGVGEVAISFSAGSAESGLWDHTIRVAGNTTRTHRRGSSRAPRSDCAARTARAGHWIGSKGTTWCWWPAESDWLPCGRRLNSCSASVTDSAD